MAKRFNWGYLILGILFILIALLSFRDPASNLVAIVLVFAVMAILKGIFELVVRRKMEEFAGQSGVPMIIIGILDIVLGIFLLFNTTVGIIALPIVFAAWFIVDSFGELMVAGAYKNISTGYYWFKIIINLLGIVLGILLLFNPLSAALTLAFLVGFYFMMTGITYIVAAF